MQSLSKIAPAICGILVLSASPARADEAITYTYDALGRLVAVDSSGSVNNGRTVAVVYDAAGNRTNYTATMDGSGSGGEQEPPAETSPQFRVVFNGRFFIQLQPN